MKLNLLPSSVSRGKQVKGAVFVSVLIALASIGMSVLMVTTSTKHLELAKTKATEMKAAVDQDVQIAAQAETIMADPQLANVIRQTNLAKAMNRHNFVYPKFYSDLFPYIPGFFRVNNMSVTPANGDTVTVNLQGVIRDRYQYADLMLALLRIPGSTSVTRSGFNLENPRVTPLTENDQDGRMIIPGEPVLPEDPIARVNAMINRGSVTHFEGRGNFGGGNPNIGRGAMPGSTVINVSVVMPANLFAPNPRATLAATAR